MKMNMNMNMNNWVETRVRKEKWFMVLIASTLILMFFSSGCVRSGDSSSISLSEAESQPVSKSIHGAVQKGPYLNGTSLTFFELSETLSQTGKSYNAQIKSNSGDYELSDILFTSSYVMIKADGFYFNEVTGKVSEAPLTLYAMSDIRDKSTVNINLLSHMEKDRIDYLVENGATFAAAKSQAQQEILNIFSISLSDIGLQITPPAFENFIQTFLENTSFVATSIIVYDDIGLYGENLLGSKTNFMVDDQLGVYSIEAFVPTNSRLMIRIVPPNADYGVKIGRCNEEEWKISQLFENEKLETQLQILITDTKCDAEVKLYINPGDYLIKIYENGAKSPTWTKTVSVRSRTRIDNLPGWATVPVMSDNP